MRMVNLDIIKKDATSIILEADSDFMGRTRMKLPISEKVFLACMDNWENKGLLIQNAFPMLNATQREFLLTGISNDKQWDHITKE